jgi:hypothetical protein
LFIDFTEPIPSRRAATTVEFVTAWVLVKPSSLFSVIDDRLTAVTLPFGISTVRVSPPDFGQTPGIARGLLPAAHPRRQLRSSCHRDLCPA